MLPSPTAAAQPLRRSWNGTSPQAKVPGNARLEQIWVAVVRPVVGHAHVGSREHEAVAVARDLGRQPARLRVRPDEDEEPARVHALGLAGLAVADIDGLERGLAVRGGHLGPEARADVPPGGDLVHEVAGHALLSDSPRHMIVTLLACVEKNIAACPAELPAPTMCTSSPCTFDASLRAAP